jgi:hypothetical protein
MTQQNGMQGMKPGHLPRESRSFGKGRVCVEPGCEKVLSQYNRLNKCWAHADMKIPRLRGRKPAQEAL